MLSKMFAIYDNKAEYYLNPLFFNSRGESLRNFADAVNDTNTMLHRHPADFTLFETGTYDNESATVTMHSSGINLGNAIEFLVDNMNQNLSDPTDKLPVHHNGT